MALYKIIDNLYISDATSAQNEYLLSKLHTIKAILTVMDFDLPLKLASITYKRIELLDMSTEDILSHFDSSFDFIDSFRSKEKPESVLVHCYAGRSRSATVCIAYLMRKLELSVSEAAEFINGAVKYGVQANPGFMEQLSLYEKMGTKVDRDSQWFKQHLLKMYANNMDNLGIIFSLVSNF